MHTEMSRLDPKDPNKKAPSLSCGNRTSFQKTSCHRVTQSVYRDFRVLERLFMRSTVKGSSVMMTYPVS